jgi:hypothetical protein
MQSMTRTPLTAVLAAAIAGTSLASPLAAKARKHKPAPPAHAWSAPGAQQPARMIEVRPGLWISSYGCISDEGYGRYLPCDLTDGKR